MKFCIQSTDFSVQRHRKRFEGKNTFYFSSIPVAPVDRGVNISDGSLVSCVNKSFLLSATSTLSTQLDKLLLRRQTSLRKRLFVFPRFVQPFPLRFALYVLVYTCVPSETFEFTLSSSQAGVALAEGNRHTAASLASRLLRAGWKVPRK